ncbi:MAG: GAF domain-containing protein [gamma proteobacterium symbiont of Bathyaustriella thionipta]|nr:GAF domain-containing protein [gamma proteobacterium symbiont of Bathyaustriella thionipta]MCU7950313.1 GAF domain-containing protein [gamma proteobacterium symbiont of Bathyaustriella thionipta]MCU7952317.1 GAF domain-containing protein [gamma proteobacterium symbiont of Bathyaustriella thionipta]MCU7956832.1 GAF domain-containing protein [gamma proteobacterium symbiont of Bathyaustriella thionipta]MCU7966601.1 GAF domain-containing protein [gamma proteobacterium symbiont of Bathyaustriella
MHTFIRVIEIWTPSGSGEVLEFNNGCYGPLEEFKNSSMKETFAYGEGLPGSAWKKARPVVLKEFDNTSFLRTEVAHEVGLTSAVAIPIFSGETLKAVIVFLCGDTNELSGAIEVWSDDGLSGLALIDGYYGDLERFEWLSKSIKFPRGRGLPGKVWETTQPLIMGDLASSNSFLRSKAAADKGITTSIAIPVNSNEDIEDIGSVVTFLSSKSTPIAKRFEIWTPDEEGNSLQFESGIIQDSEEVEAANPKRCIQKGKGVIGETLLSGIPVMSSELTADSLPEITTANVDDYTSLLAIPIYYQENLNSVVAFYN